MRRNEKNWKPNYFINCYTQTMSAPVLCHDADDYIYMYAYNACIFVRNWCGNELRCEKEWQNGMAHKREDISGIFCCAIRSRVLYIFFFVIIIVGGGGGGISLRFSPILSFVLPFCALSAHPIQMVVRVLNNAIYSMNSPRTDKN